MITEYDKKLLMELGLSEDTIKYANDNNHFHNGSSNFQFALWTEYTKFFKIQLSLIDSSNISIYELGTGDLIRSIDYKTTQEALDDYLEILDGNYFNYKPVFILKIILYYISDILFKFVALPILFLFKFKDFIKTFKDVTIKQITSSLFNKTLIDFSFFNDNVILFLAVPVIFTLGAIIF
jgi:hypothetical protein